MKWEEVRKLYPNQYVKLQILEYHVVGDEKNVTDVAIVNPIQDPKVATRELLKSKGDTIVYHTGANEIKIMIRNQVGLRSLRL
jgi:hypothetical protein